MGKKKYTDEQIIEDAKKYSSKVEWKTYSERMYRAAYRKGLLPIACAHMEVLWEKKWDEQSILEDAKKYKSRAEWKRNSKAYDAAFKRGLLPKATEHMELLIDHGKWTDEAILEDAKQYNTKVEWQKNSKGYAAAQKKGLLDIATKHMTIQWEQKWDRDSILKDAKKYNSKSEWRKNSGGYQAAKKYGLFEEATAHMKPMLEYWTEEKVLEDAKKYSSRSEWRRCNSNSYGAAIRLNILKKASSHMTLLVDHDKWNKKRILEDAKQYSSRSAWKDGSSGYYAALARGLVDEACMHMKRAGGSSTAEKHLMNKIKALYPKAQTLRDRKIHIPNKPHITGFHIDIYIPELRKGIEFDGEYWYSIKGLKKSRPNWPEEDLANYHKLKDEYFAKKGIEIIHIDEADWNKNPEQVWERILAFLEAKTQS